MGDVGLQRLNPEDSIFQFGDHMLDFEMFFVTWDGVLNNWSFYKLGSQVDEACLLELLFLI
jgi:hypothetical protein